MVLSPAIVDLLGPYLARQRWYAGAGEPDPGSLTLLESDCLAETPGGRRLLWAIVGVDAVRYQLLLADEAHPEGAGGADPQGAGGADPGGAGGAGPQGAGGAGPGGGSADGAVPAAGLVGTVGDRRLYDAVVDPELLLLFFERLAGRPATKVRAVGVEQSNTSLVYDDQVIVKMYRRLAEGVNPDIEVTSALAAAGFDHVAEPVATWRADGVDLAFAQRFLAGGSEGWALAVASARELIDGQADDPAAAPGDFAAESEDLGRVTAGLHLALAGAFGVDQEVLAGGWAAFVEELERRTVELDPGSGPGDHGGAGRDALDRAFARLRGVDRPGPAIRLHGDYHLGQVMRAGGRWYVLDFEGEPARSLEERTRRSSVAKDVSGMLRSIDYAARYALRGVESASSRPDAGPMVERAEAWEARNRSAFLDGYFATPGVGALVAGEDDAEAVFAAFELDKALYELRYEEAYRPEWVPIPRAAIGRIVERLGAAGGNRSRG